MKQSFFKRVPWLALIAAWLIVIAGSLTADGLKGETLFSSWWPALADYQWLVTAGIAVVFVAASLWLYHNRQVFTLARSLSRHLCEPHSSVILLVSTPNPKPSPASSLFPLRLQDRDISVELSGESLEGDITELSKIRWNWQQLLRAILPHRSKLQRIHLIGSPGSEGSFSHLNLCKEMLEKYLPGAQILKVDEPIDFEDFNSLVQCIRGIINEEKGQGMKERDIIIDVTGGVKTASIAGASITFNSHVTFQYVQTQPPYEVYAYDVIYQSPLSPEG